MTVASGGAGDITLGTAVAGYQTFADAGISDTDILRYTIEDGDDWEIGTGVYTASGTTLVRTVTESSNSDAAITCSADAVIFVTMAAEDFTGNVEPRFTTPPAASLSLASDGSSVTLTGLAVDEGGFPISYSWDGFSGATVYTDSSLPAQLASAPTINQATGVVSLIGSQSTSNGGSFKFRLKASDGIKTAVATSEILLSFPFDIANATYNNVNFSINAQEANVTSLAFNPSGTKMYIVGYSSDTVFQYSLSSGFDLSTASYNSVSFSVAGQDGQPQELAFNPSGTKMFILGQDNGSVFQYSLSSGFDLSTASYDNVSFTLQANNYELGLAFSTDGTRFFVVNSVNRLVEQYSCSSGFDLSTASYDNVSFSVSSQDADPSALAFNNSGTKMYMVGYANDKVYQYGLSTGFDVSTASYDNVYFSVASQLGRAQGLAFGGGKMFLTGRSSSKVFEYDL